MEWDLIWVISWWEIYQIELNMSAWLLRGWSNILYMYQGSCMRWGLICNSLWSQSSLNAQKLFTTINYVSSFMIYWSAELKYTCNFILWNIDRNNIMWSMIFVISSHTTSNDNHCSVSFLMECFQISFIHAANATLIIHSQGSITWKLIDLCMHAMFNTHYSFKQRKSQNKFLSFVFSF